MLPTLREIEKRLGDGRAEALNFTRAQNGLPKTTSSEPAAERRELRGQIAGRVGERAVDRFRQGSQGTNSRQGEQDQQQRVFRQVLTFLFFPQLYEKIPHVYSPFGCGVQAGRGTSSPAVASLDDAILEPRDVAA